jgi:predicted phage terminase large subunit-like protein
MWRRALLAALALVVAMAVDVRALPTLDAARAERIRRERIANPPGLLEFANAMHEARTGAPLKAAPHQAVICDSLERVAGGECKRLIINVPPRSGKTDLAVVGFMAWSMGRWPDAEFIHASYSAELATLNASKTRDLMQHERFAAFFGAPSFNAGSRAKDHFRTTQGGQVYASGAGGTITGFGAGKMRAGFGGAIVIDDPHKADEAQSRTMRQNVVNWFRNTVESRKNSPHTPIIVIMQRHHVADLSGWLLAGGNGEQWEAVVIPALDAAGVSFWPEQFPPEYLAAIQAGAQVDGVDGTGAYVFASQYQQRPQVLGGNIVKGEWFPTCRDLPRLEYRNIYADTASKTGTANDYSVFQCWGRSSDRRAYLIDQIRGKWAAPELERRALAFVRKHAEMDEDQFGLLRYLKIEEASSGIGLIQSAGQKNLIAVQGIKRTKDKFSRLYDALPAMQSGRVVLPEDAPFLSDWLAEAEAMTADDTHAHDDQIDPALDAISDMVTLKRGSWNLDEEDAA